MGRPHHIHHRRAPQADAVADSAATKVVTVNVEVIATVDTSGNVVGQETRTRADSSAPTPAAGADGASSNHDDASVEVAGASNLVTPPIAAVDPMASSVVAVLPPSVPAFPSLANPSVPAVVPFPSDLRVPSVVPYPWASGVSALAVATTATLPTIPLTPTAAVSSSGILTQSSAFKPSLNSTLSHSSSLISSRITPASLSVSASSVGPSSSSFTTDATTTTSSDVESATRSLSLSRSTTSADSSFDAGGGSPNTAAPRPQGTAAAGTGQNSSAPSTPLPTPQVVGSVVGSLAGAALILAIILLLLRRHKRQRRGALQLTEDEHSDNRPVMTQESPRNNRIPSAFLHRFSGMSRSTADTSTSGGERSFQRVSGRKLPSAFSEGMTSEQFSRGGTLSGSSFYQDDHGTYGGPGTTKDFAKDIGAPVAANAGAMNIRPSPARTPVIRHPDDDVNPFADPAPFARTQSHLSPPQSPNSDNRRGTLGRSLQSHDGSRSSKFTENV